MGLKIDKSIICMLYVLIKHILSNTFINRSIEIRGNKWLGFKKIKENNWKIEKK
jgi:hypothetical protein